MAVRSSEVDHMEGTPDMLYSHDWGFGSVLPLVAKIELLHFRQQLHFSKPPSSQTFDSSNS